MINETSMMPFLLYDKPYPYNDIMIYPVKMGDILEFQIYQRCLVLRKNSWFPDKQIIKMTYMDFLFFCSNNPEYLNKFNDKNDEMFDFSDSGLYYFYFLQLLTIVCKESKEIKYNQVTGQIYIDETEITPQMFDDIRRIIILQNGIDFDPDEFMNVSTEKALNRALRHNNKNNNNATIEDYIDSVVVSLGMPVSAIEEMSIRKFWRYLDRINMHESYTIMKTGECSGFVQYKEEIKHWMISLNKKDKYSSLKTDEKDLRDKISS